MAGEDFVVDARRVLEASERMTRRTKARSAGKLGRATVGFCKLLTVSGFRAALDDLREQYRDIFVELNESPYIDLIVEVLSSVLDTAVILGEAGTGEVLNFRTLWSERFVVALPKKRSLADKQLIYCWR